MTHEPDIIREAERILREAREPQRSPLVGLVNPGVPTDAEILVAIDRMILGVRRAFFATGLITYDGTQEDYGDVSR